jgi:5-methyltetrahydrofolate--homocysteine methyltransferase
MCIGASVAELGFGHMDAARKRQAVAAGLSGQPLFVWLSGLPNLEDQVPLLKLLGAERIGVELSDGFQLHPEQSTSAIVLHHPKARYFSV